MPSDDRKSVLWRRLRFAFGALRRTVFAWGLAIWAAVGALWNALGRYDLALSQLISPETAAKFPRVYQGLAMLSAWLSSWVFWTVGGLILAFVAAVEYGVRAEMRGEMNAEAKRKAAIPTRAPYPPDAPITVIADKAMRFVGAFEKALTQSPGPKSTSPAIPMPLDPEPEWDKLYGLSEDGREIRLLFLPDDEDVEGHALLLVPYGYRVWFGADRIPQRQAVSETLRALREAPNAPFAARTAPFLVSFKSLEPETVGRHAFERGEIERVGLSTGGQLQITGLGIERADALARDLIRRA